jgi:hypothetical protein
MKLGHLKEGEIFTYRGITWMSGAWDDLYPDHVQVSPLSKELPVAEGQMVMLPLDVDITDRIRASEIDQLFQPKAIRQEVSYYVQRLRARANSTAS